MFPLIPAELGVHPLLWPCCTPTSSSTGRSGRGEPGGVEEAMEYLAAYLQRLSGPDLRRASEDMDTLVGFAKQQKWPKQQVAVPARLPDRQRRVASEASRVLSPPPVADLTEITMTSTNPLERYSRQMRVPRHRQGRAGGMLASRASPLCGCGALGTVLANPWSGPASGSSASSTATSSSRQQPPAAGAVRRVGRGRTTCPRPRPPRSSCGRSTRRSRSSRSSPTSTAPTSRTCAGTPT